MTRTRVLLSAYACHPEGKSGLGFSEDMVGWTVARQLARFAEVWVITSAQCRPGFEEALARNPVPNLHVHFVSLYPWLKWMRRFQGGLQLYDYLWQIPAHLASRKLHRQVGFHAAHHITYANDWMASYIGAFLHVPYIRGPGGGAHKTPPGFDREYPWFSRVWEAIRSAGQWFLRRDPVFVLGQRRAKALLLCNYESFHDAERRWKGKAHLFPVNGISTEDLARALPKNAARSGTFKVLSVGTLTRIKGFPIALRSFAAFAARHPDSEFTIIGEGADLVKLTALAQQLGIAGNVRFLGWLPHDDVLAAMRTSHAFLFPSLRDGGGAVVVEAMAAGLPVICLDAGGPAFHVRDEWGIKLPATNPTDVEQKITAALERLVLDEPYRRSLGMAARKRAEEFYHWDRLGEHLWQIYHETLALRSVPITPATKFQ